MPTECSGRSFCVREEANEVFWASDVECRFGKSEYADAVFGNVALFSAESCCPFGLGFDAGLSDPDEVRRRVCSTEETRDLGLRTRVSRDGRGAIIDVGRLGTVLSAGPVLKLCSGSTMSRISLRASDEVSDSMTLHREYLCDKFGKLKFGTSETGLLSASQKLSLRFSGCAIGGCFGDNEFRRGRSLTVS